MEAGQGGEQAQGEGGEEEEGAAGAGHAQVEARGREADEEGTDRGVQVQEGVGQAEGETD